MGLEHKGHQRLLPQYKYDAQEVFVGAYLSCMYVCIFLCQQEETTHQ